MEIFKKGKSSKLYLELLKSGDLKDDDMKEALSDIGTISRMSVEELAPYLVHANKNIMKFAFTALCENHERGKIEKLFNIYRKESNSQLTQIVTQLILRCKSQEIFAQVSKMLNTSDVTVREKAHKIFILTPFWEDMREMVESLMEDPDPKISFNMIKTVIHDAGDKYIGYIRFLANSDNDDIRALSLRYLISKKNPQNATLFFNRIPHEKSPLREELINEVANYSKNSPENMQKRIISALTDNSNEVREMAIDLYVKLPNQSNLLKLFLTYSVKVTPWLRNMMFETAKKHDNHFAELILTAMKIKESSEFNHQLVEFAKVLKHPRLAPIFLAGLRDNDWSVRYQAIQVLSGMKSEEAIPILLRELNDSNTSIAAIRALGSYNDIKLAPFLLQKLTKSTKAEQIEIMSVLSKIPDKRFLPYLMRFLKECNTVPDAKNACIKVINEICEKTGEKLPLNLDEINVTKKASTDWNDIPDLGLKLEKKDRYDKDNW